MRKHLLIMFLLAIGAVSGADAACMTAATVRNSAENTGSSVVQLVQLRDNPHKILLVFEDGSGAVLTSESGCVSEFYVVPDPITVDAILVNEGLGS